jgi:hypothetical protein
MIELEGIVIPFSMPNIIINSSTFIGIESPDVYDNLISVPENVEWLSDTTLLSYQQPYVVLDYQFTCENSAHTHPKNIHQILVWDHTYLFKVIETEKVYKLKFEDYNNGVVLFKYSELNTDYIN